MINRYASYCVSCGRLVPAGDGTLARVPRGWQVQHRDCEDASTQEFLDAIGLPRRSGVTQRAASGMRTHFDATRLKHHPYGEEE
jgi:hypothetical protein